MKVTAFLSTNINHWLTEREWAMIKSCDLELGHSNYSSDDANLWTALSNTSSQRTDETLYLFSGTEVLMTVSFAQIRVGLTLMVNYCLIWSLCHWSKHISKPITAGDYVCVRVCIHVYVLCVCVCVCVCEWVCFLVAKCPSYMLVYLRDGSAQTILQADTLR